MKMYVVGGYKDGKIRVGLLDKVWKSKAGTELVTLKILDHYKEHKTVYRTYHPWMNDHPSNRTLKNVFEQFEPKVIKN